ncbi:MAG: hypothetical protein WBR13_10025 [Allosphingosinicella sp.]
MIRFFGIFARLATPPFIGAFLMPSLLEKLAALGFAPDMSKILGRIWDVLTSPLMFGLGMFLLGWWCATIYLELNDRRDHDLTLLEQSRVRAILGRSRHALSWFLIPYGLRNYQTNRTNEALEVVGFATPAGLEPEDETPQARHSKALLAYYEILRILIKRVGFQSAREWSPSIKRLLFTEDGPGPCRSEGGDNEAPDSATA